MEATSTVVTGGILRAALQVVRAEFRAEFAELRAVPAAATSRRTSRVASIPSTTFPVS